MATPLRLLILEDSPSDAELMLHALRHAGYDPVADRVATEQDYRDRLQAAPEIVLADFSMPEFDALRALEIMQECRLDIPVIIVSVAIGEERAVQVMQGGATDYIVKDRMERLGHAVSQALEQKRLREANRRAEQALRENEELARKAEEAQQRERAASKQVQEQTVAMNEALLLGSLRQHELTEVADSLNVQLLKVIAERKQAEKELRASDERFRTLFELGPVAVYSCDVSGVIQEFNRRAAELWLREPALGDTDERFCGSFKLFRPDGSLMSHEQCPMAEVLSGKIPGARDAEVLIERPDGSRVVVIVNIRPLKNERGEVTGAINCFYDITERKKAEEALRDADRRKDQFLATLAHELRNPLAPIKNAAHILRMLKIENATVNRAQRIIERQANHLAKLVDDLLDISRIQQGKFSLHKEHLDLGKAVSRAVESCEHLIHLQDHTISVEIQSSPPLHIDADPTRVDQILGNIITNAAKYTPSRGSIKISAAHERGMAVVRVRDNGLGIESQMLQRIFDVFTQVEQSVERSQGGLGLGLKLVKDLAEMHGGSVEAKSEGLNKGSEFVVRLPALEKTDPKLIAAVVIPEFRGSSKRILVVDDNADIRETMEMELSMSGHSVELAEDGLQAVEKALQTHPDVAFIDIGLPKMDGYDVAREIRSRPGGADLVLIAVSGYGQDEDKRKALEAGFDAHLTKPMEAGAIDKILSELESFHRSHA